MQKGWVCHVYGVDVICDFLLSNLESHATKNFDATRAILCQHHTAAFSPQTPIKWVDQNGTTDQSSKIDGWLSLGYDSEGMLFRFHSVVDFYIRGRVVDCYPKNGMMTPTIEHFLLDTVLPVVVSMLGKLVIHSGAMQIGDSVVLFCGESGMGKSTLTTYLASKGHPFLTDDCLAVDVEDGRFTAHPSYPSVRLWAQSSDHLIENTANLPTVAQYTTKKRAPLDKHLPDFRFCTKPLPISHIYLLTKPSDTIAIEPIARQKAFALLQKQLFIPNLTSKSAIAAQFMAVIRLLNTIPSSLLSYPRDFDRLGDVRQAIVDHHHSNIQHAVNSV